MVLPSQEPEVQQKQTDHAEAPQEQPASQPAATLGATASEDATASTALDMSHQDSQAQMAMPGQAYTELASRAESIAAPPLVSVAPDKSGGQSEPPKPVEQATIACDTDDADTGPNVLSSSGDQHRQQSACQPADSIHTDSLDDADNSPTVKSLRAEAVDQQRVSSVDTLVGIVLAEPTVPDTNATQQQLQQQSSLAQQLEATVAPAAAEAKQANGGPAVQRQQASTDELSESAQAVGDKLNTSATAVSSADAQSRASPATAGAFAKPDAEPSGHAGQLEVNILDLFVLVCYQCLPSQRRTVLPSVYASKALLTFFWQHALFDQFTTCELPCSQEPWHTCYQTSAVKENVLSDP